MLSASEHRYQCFRFSSLCRLIYQYLSESEILQSSVESSQTRSTYNFSILKYLIFSLSLEIFQLSLFFFSELILFLSFKDQFLHSLELTMVEMLDLLMQGQIIYVGTH